MFLALLSCKEQKTDFSGETPVKIKDFLAVFPKLTLPFSLSDSNMFKKADTLSIGLKAFTQIFPDSALFRL